MKSETKIPENIDEYIAGFPREVQAILQKVRTTIPRRIDNFVNKNVRIRKIGPLLAQRKLRF